MAPDVSDINEEILLGRTLLEQGHLGTAQRVLVKICQAHPDNAEAVRVLSDLLHRKGDEARSRIMGDYAKDLRGLPPQERHTTPAPTKSDPEPQMPPAPRADSLPAGKTKIFLGDETGVPQVAPPGPPATMPHLATEAPAKPLDTGESGMPQVAPGSPPTMPHASNTPATPAPQPQAQQPAAPHAPPPPVQTDGPPPASIETSKPAKTAAVPTRDRSAARRKKSKKGKVLALLILLGLLGGGGWYGFRTWQQRPPQRPSFAAREELDSALASGSLARMMRIRERARTALAGPKVDPDGLVRLALVDALLSLDYGVASAKSSAEESLGKMPPADPKEPQRQALVEAVRAVLSLDAGDRAAAQQHVQSGLGESGAQPILLLLSARLHSLSGDLATAGLELDRAVGAAPDFAPVIADWGLYKLDAGDPASARRVLKDFLGKNRTATRVHLVAAEVERALGETAWKRHVDIACHGDNRAARGLRAACILAAAQDARMDGERASAIRKAKAAAQGGDDARLLADAAMVLALLGEIDSADELLERARKVADDAAVPLAWAGLAVRLGRGQLDGPAPPSDRPPLSERALLVLRAQYLKGGGRALTPIVKDVAAGLPELDSDLRTYMELAGQDGPSKSDRANLERRADRGNPVASFVLGILAARDNDHKLAAKRLERAMSGHGDVCRAALLYLQALQGLDKPPQPNRNALRGLRGRCAACPLPEI